MFVRGGGSFYNLLNKNIKELNIIKLSVISIIFLVLVGFLSYKITNSYALFTNEVTGTKTIEITPNLNLDKSRANEPVLDSSMIPVYYDETNNVWRKADESNKSKTYKWYDYDNKMWANSITVSSTNRVTYQKASMGTEISMDDILTMQVWIPRYKYKVWNYNSDGTKTSNPQEIEITFEKEDENTSEISCTDSISGTEGKPSETCKLKETNSTCTDSTCNNKTYTHPAFTFGDEEIKGFWIGKFELTGTIDNITTKPDLQSLRNQNVSSFETNIMKMNSTGNIYGLSTSVDTHMIKNMEWGAVAYLSHSKYGTCTDGTCTEVGINNNSNYITGCGSEAGSTSSTTCNIYNTELGKLASTTNNIYGIYDMSGGSNDYVMGNVVSTDGVTMLSVSSGYTSSSYPNSKYYDVYSYSKTLNLRIKSKLGDGIKEVYNTGNYGWYSDNSNMIASDYSWFARGGAYNDVSNAGIFYSHYINGGALNANSSRFIIIP